MGNKLSVIVQASQQSLALSKCLAALAEQRLSTEELEVVVVDPQCRRSIHQLVRWWNLSLARRGRRARFVHIPLRERSGDGDRAGLRASSGSLVAFVDESASPAPDWAARAIEELLLRENFPPDIAPPPLSRNIVQRRNYLTAALAIDERAVSGSGMSVEQLANDSTMSRRFRAATANRGVVIARFDRSARRRFASVEAYAALAALFVALGMILLQRYEVAGAAALAFAVFSTVVIRRYRHRSRGGEVRPFAPMLRTSHLRSDA